MASMSFRFSDGSRRLLPWQYIVKSMSETMDFVPLRETAAERYSRKGSPYRFGRMRRAGVGLSMSGSFASTRSIAAP